MRDARSRGAHVAAATIILGSQLTRGAHSAPHLRAGLEVRVAAHKPPVPQGVLMALLALKLGTVREAVGPARAAELLAEVRRLPDLVEATLRAGDDALETIAESVWEREFFLYLGRNVGLPIAHEGALKLKEISYVP